MKAAVFGLALAGAVSVMPALAAPALVPLPAEMREGSGAGFDIAAATRIVVPPHDKAAWQSARYLQAKLLQTTQLRLGVVVSHKIRPGDIVFALDKKAAQGTEAYLLRVADGVASVRAPSAAGLFYGSVTLWQLLTETPGGHLGDVTITDHPRFGWRGLMLDSARHMQSTAYIERFIDWMAVHKLNRFHWHLADDQGWRIEIKRYPRLMSVAAWRQAVWPDVGDKNGRYGGFYTQAEIRHIVAYAKARHITVVPEIDLPGHSTALIAAYPKLGVAGFKPEPVTADWGLLPEVLNVEEPTFHFIENVLTEVMALFPGRYIHLGGDEVDTSQWHASPQVQAKMRALGISDEAALERWFISRISRFLASHGRRLVGWDEIQEGESAGGLDPQAVVMSWHGGDGAAKAVNGGHDVIIAQAPIYYLDNSQARSQSEPPGWSDIMSLKRVYQNDPVPAGLGDTAKEHVLGLQGQMWTERARKEEWITTLVYPRAAAIAEVGWTPREKLSWPDFESRMAVQKSRYRLLGLKASDAAGDGSTVDPPDPARKSSLALSFCDPNTTGFVQETPAGAAGDFARVMTTYSYSCWLDKGVDLSNARRIEISLVHLPFNQRLGSAHPVAKFAPPRTPQGEIEVRLDRLDGPVLVSLPLAGFADDKARTVLSGEFTSPGGVHDLYFVTTGEDIDSRNTMRRPLPAINWVSLH